MSSNALDTVRVIVKLPLNARTNARCRLYGTPMPIPVECPCPYLSNARLCSSRTPVPVDIASTTIAKVRPFCLSAESVPEGVNHLVCQRYKQFACRVNQPASTWVALSAKRMLIFSLVNSFAKIRDCTPLYADSFGFNARHS